MMTSNLIDEVLLLSAFWVLIMVVLFAVTFWMNHFSRKAKALSRRLDDIINIRSSVSDNHLMKAGQENAGNTLPGEDLAITTRINEAVKLTLLRADVSMTSVKFIMISLGIAFTSLFLLSLSTHLSFLMLMLMSSLLGAVPFFYILRLEAKRTAKIEGQLPEALDFICRSLRAGHGLSVSFGIVGDELPQPIAKEFKNVYEEINFGLPFNEAMTNLALRTDSGDIDFLVVALLIQREAGGNLIELLENLSKTIRDRMILKGKIRVLASEGKFSGVLLSVLPFVLGSVLSVMNPDYMSLLWTSEAGQQLVMVSLLMILIGGFWMWNLSRIKV